MIYLSSGRGWPLPFSSRTTSSKGSRTTTCMYYTAVLGSKQQTTHVTGPFVPAYRDQRTTCAHITHIPLHSNYPGPLRGYSCILLARSRTSMLDDDLVLYYRLKTQPLGSRLCLSVLCPTTRHKREPICLGGTYLREKKKKKKTGSPVSCRDLPFNISVRPSMPKRNESRDGWRYPS